MTALQSIYSARRPQRCTATAVPTFAAREGCDIQEHSVGHPGHGELVRLAPTWWCGSENVREVARAAQHAQNDRWCSGPRRCVCL